MSQPSPVTHHSTSQGLFGVLEFAVEENSPKIRSFHGLAPHQSAGLRLERNRKEFLLDVLPPLIDLLLSEWRKLNIERFSLSC